MGYWSFAMSSKSTSSPSLDCAFTTIFRFPRFKLTCVGFNGLSRSLEDIAESVFKASSMLGYTKTAILLSKKKKTCKIVDATSSGRELTNCVKYRIRKTPGSGGKYRFEMIQISKGARGKLVQTNLDTVTFIGTMEEIEDFVHSL